MNMTLSIGFVNELTFIRLLTPNVKQLQFRSSVVTDPMLKCIGERCGVNLQELRIFDSKWAGRQLELTTDGLIACIKRLYHVKAIQIAECDKVNDKLIKTISENCRQLESLWLNDCKNVTDRSSEYLQSMQLHDLNLANTSVSKRLNSYEFRVSFFYDDSIQIHTKHIVFYLRFSRLQINGWNN